MGGGVSENGNKGDGGKRKRKQGVGGQSKRKAEGVEIDQRISGSDSHSIHVCKGDSWETWERHAVVKNLVGKSLCAMQGCK